MTATLLKNDGVLSSEIKKHLSSHVARCENSYNKVQEVLVPPQNSDVTDPIESCSDELGEDPSIRRALQTVAMTSEDPSMVDKLMDLHALLAGSSTTPPEEELQDDYGDDLSLEDIMKHLDDHRVIEDLVTYEGQYGDFNNPFAFAASNNPDVLTRGKML